MKVLYDKIHELEKKLRSTSAIINSDITIASHNNRPIRLWLIPFRFMIRHKSEYDSIFGKSIVDSLMHSSGAFVYKTPDFYGIIVNLDRFDKFDVSTKNFIISHELGHIFNNDLDDSNVTGIIRERNADLYAKSCGFSINTSPILLTLWEVYSLIPKKIYKQKWLMYFLRSLFFIKHIIPNIIRVYNNR